YGVPQKRERLFIVAVRADLGVEWSFPSPSHSSESLLWEQYGSGVYWEKHRIPSKRRPQPSGELRERVRTFKTRLLPPTMASWKTVRDAISDLPKPQVKRSNDEP